MGAQPAPLPCTLPPLVGAGEQPAPHPGNKRGGIRRIAEGEGSGKPANVAAAGKEARGEEAGIPDGDADADQLGQPVPVPVKRKSNLGKVG